MSGNGGSNGLRNRLLLALAIAVAVGLVVAVMASGRSKPPEDVASHTPEVVMEEELLAEDPGDDLDEVEEAEEELEAGASAEPGPEREPKREAEGSPSASGPDERPEAAVDPANLIDLQQTPDSSFLYDTSIASLMTADAYLNGQTVQVIGEVVGDRIRAENAPDFCWITLESTDKEPSVVAVYLSRTLTQAIDTYGAYGRQGTVCQARGVFNLACPEHDGLTDLHVDHLSVVRKGVVTPDKLDGFAFLPGALLVVVALGLLGAYRRLREGNL